MAQFIPISHHGFLWSSFTQKKQNMEKSIDRSGFKFRPETGEFLHPLSFRKGKQSSRLQGGAIEKDGIKRLEVSDD